MSTRPHRYRKQTDFGPVCLGCGEVLVSPLAMSVHQACIPEEQFYILGQVVDNLIDHLEVNIGTEWQYRWGLESEVTVGTERAEDKALVEALEDWVRAQLKKDWKKVARADRSINPGAWEEE